MDHKLEAIEIYQEILKLTKGQDFNDVITAISFARNKIEQDYYAEQKNKYGSGQLLGGFATPGLANGCVRSDATQAPQE